MKRILVGMLLILSMWALKTIEAPVATDHAVQLAGELGDVKPTQAPQPKGRGVAIDVVQA